MNFNYDYFGLTEPARFYLCKTDNTIVCELNGIDLQSVSYTKQLNNFDTIQFDVHRYVNGEESNGYDMLDEAMYIFVDGIGYFRISYPTVSNDGFDEYKSITAQSCECELALKTLKNFKINTGEVDSYEYLVTNNVKETDEGVKIAKKSITLYDQEYPELSLLHLALDKVSGWKIGIVDQTVVLTTIEEIIVNEDGSITTKTETNASKRTFDIDSKSVYAFLTQDVSKKFECIFDFDIMTRTINVYDVKTYGKDSNVFISYRNLIQELNYSPVQENNILTRFDVRGADDLTIDAVNFGTSTIEDLSYYLSTDHHVSDDLVDHYNKWLRAIEEARKKYMALNRQYNILMEKRDEINNRVPNDGLNNNWKQFTIKELDTIKKKYTGYMDALKDKDLGYWDATNKKWLNKGAEQDYIAYQGIIEIIDQTIKYKQASVTETKKEQDALDDLLEEWNTNWDLFGLAELKTKEKVYLQNIEALSSYKTEWKNLSEDEQGHLTKANYEISHNNYMKYWKYEYGVDENGNPYNEKEKGGCSKAIKDRKAEYVSLQTQMKKLSSDMEIIAEVNDKVKYGFSESELATLNKLYDDTDYTNENILTTSIDTAEKIINTQYELLKDAQTELSKVCQPQLSFTLTMDNIFAIPGFKEWQGNFDIGNYVHLSFDGNDQYFLKLRISSLTFNPCIIENDFQIEFTNMISYNGGRDDFAALLDESVSTVKSQVAGSVKSKLDTSGIEVSDSLIKALVNSSSMSNAIANGVFDTVSANIGTFGQLISTTVNARDLLANSGLFDKVNVDETTSKYVLALEINANRISAGTLAVDRLIIRGEKNSIMYSINNSLGKLDTTNISPKDYDKYYMGGENIQAHSITADQILAHSITASELTINDIRGINGWINLHAGTFAFYGKPVQQLLDDIRKDKEDIDNYITSLETPTDAQYKFKELFNFTYTGLTQEQLMEVIQKLSPYSQDDNNVLDALRKKDLIRLINNLNDYIIWLNVNDKIYKDGKSADDLVNMSDETLISEFGVSQDKCNTIKTFINYIVENSINGLMAWDGSKLTVRGDIVANSLTLGSNVQIGYENLPTIENYINEKGIIVNEPKEGFTGFKIAKNGALTASNAVIYGTIWASDGKIGGLTLSQNAMYSTDHSSFNSTNDGVYISPEYIALGPSGSVYFNKNGTGKIGAWSINSEAFYTGDGFNSTTGKYFGNSGLSITDKFVVQSNGNFTFGGANGIKYDGSKVTLGADISITWNQVSGTGNIATTDQIPSEATITTISNKAIQAATISGDKIKGGTITGTTISGINFTGCTGDFSGTITASSGKIGLFKISSDGSIYNKPYGTTGSGSDSCGISVSTGKYAFWAGSGSFYVNQDGSMHCANADINGSIASSNGTQNLLVENGAIYIKNGDSHRAFFGLDNDGNSAWLQIYDPAYGYSITPPVVISAKGFDGKVKNTKGDYKIPVSSSGTPEHYVDTIQSKTSNSGNKEIVVYGRYGGDKVVSASFSSSGSDARLKKNIRNTSVSNALEQILKIQHRQFNWKDTGIFDDLGYIAQELKTINPNLVSEPQAEDSYYTINTFYMESLITKSIQEMYTELKAENKALKKRIEVLENQII